MPSDSVNLGHGGVLDFAAKLQKEFGGTDGLAKKFRDAYEGASEPTQRAILVEVAKIQANAAEIRGAAEANRMTTQQLREACLRMLREHGGVPPWPEKPQEAQGGNPGAS